MAETVIKNFNERTGSSVVVEDDGRVCYAYFLSPAGEIGGDVWLYNRCPAPEQPEWTDREKAPFANAAGFAKQEAGFDLPESESDFSFRWSTAATVEQVDIYVRTTHIGRVRLGDKPGYALAAARSGPLARPLQDRR